MRNDKARVAFLAYALVAGLAVALGFLRGNPDLYHHPSPLVRLPEWLGLIAGAGGGLGLGLAVVWVTQAAVARWRLAPALKVHVGLRELLGVGSVPLSERDVLVLALSSALAEELFFRGWLQPWVGLLASSAIFGALHVAPRRYGMWWWIPMAVAMGLALGLLYELSGNLVGPIVLHLVVNYRNLHFVNSYDPQLAVYTGRHRPVSSSVGERERA